MDFRVVLTTRAAASVLNVCSLTFCNDRYPKSKNKNFLLESILVKKGASIGANATILPGVTIGENAMIGAGAIVTKDVAPNTTIIKRN